MKTKIEKRDLLLFIITFSVILFISIIWIINSPAIYVEYKTETPGSIQLFYQDQKEIGYSEDNSIQKNFFNTKKEENMKFSIPTNNISKIRIDLDETNEIVLTNIYYKLGIFLYAKVDISNLEKNIETYDSKINNTSEGAVWKRTGDDAWISIEKNDFCILKSQLIISGCILLFFIFCITFLCIFILSKLEIHILKKISKILIFSISMVSMLIMTIKNFSIINSTKEVTYQVQTENKYIENIKDELEVNFITIGKETLEYNIFIEEKQKYKGDIFFEIIDENKKVIYQKKEETETIFDYQNHKLIFNIQESSLEKGKEYTLKINFNLNQPLKIVMNDNKTVASEQVFKFIYIKEYKVIILLIDFVLIILLLIFLLKIKESTKFLIVSLISGIIGSFVVIPLNIHDEYRHFIRAYDITQGNIISNYSELSDDMKGNIIFNTVGKAPIAIIPEELNQMRLLDQGYNFDDMTYAAEMNYKICIDQYLTLLKSKNLQEEAIVSLAATDAISPFAYLPQIFMILIGRVLHFPPLIIYYLARIGNVIAASLLVWIAVKLAPQYRCWIYTFHFIPCLMWLRASSSTDGFLNALVILLLAFILFIKEQKIFIFNKKNLGILAILVCLISWIKLPYILLIYFILCLEKENINHINKDNKRFDWKLFIIKFLVATVFVIFAFLCYQISLKLFAYNEGRASIVSKECIIYIFNYPLETIKTFWKELQQLYSRYQYAINDWYAYGLKNFYSYLVIIIAFFGPKGKLSILDRIWGGLIAFGIWIVILFTFFTISGPEYQIIDGLQGRYLLPCIAIIGFSIPQIKIKFATIIEENILTVISSSIFINFIYLFVNGWV